MEVIDTSPPVGKHKNTFTACCVKWMEGLREVSIAVDDSCGGFAVPMRANVRCYDNDKDVTAAVFGFNGEQVARGDPENVIAALLWLQTGQLPKVAA